jgi:hypothetical protein
MRPVAYASRVLSSAECKYTTTERECLAIITCVKLWRPYLHGKEFTIVSNHHSLQWLMKMKDQNSRLARWYLWLQEYSFKVVHKPGKEHVNADAMS